MPTPTGLPKVGETWRHTQKLPHTISASADPTRVGQTLWKTDSCDYKILERIPGSYWSVRVTYRDNGRVKERWLVDAAWWFSKGDFVCIKDAKGNPYKGYRGKLKTQI